MIRVIAIDDHPLILKMVSEEIDRAGDMQIVGIASHGSKLHTLVREVSPDVVILDLSMSNGIFEPVSAVQQLLQEHPEIKVLILTGNDSPAYIRDLIEGGRDGVCIQIRGSEPGIAESCAHDFQWAALLFACRNQYPAFGE